MRKFLNKMLLLVLMMVPIVAMSQTVTYSCDFENDADNAAWELANGTNTNKWCIDTAAHNGVGTKGLYVSNDNGAHCAYSISSSSNVYAIHTIALTQGMYEYSYDWTSGGESSWDYMRVAIVPESATITGGSQVSGLTKNALPAGWIAIDGGSYLNMSSTWSTKTGSFYISTTGNYKIVYFWHNDSGGGDSNPAAIDNLSITMPTCPAPINLVASNIVDDGATISWTEVGSATSWNVEYEPAGVANAQTMYETATDTSITLSGLEYNTLYNVRVIADCGGDDTLYGSFRSACGAITLPYNYSFEDAPENSFPPCWYNKGGEDSPAIVVVKNSHRSLRFANGATVATPHIPLAGNLISLTFSLKREGTSSGNVQVGFVTSLDSVANMRVIATIDPIDNEFYEYEYTFASLGEDAIDEGYIVFKQMGHTSSNWYYWLSDIVISQISDCRRPASMSATNIRYASATLNWTPIEGATYEVAYGTATDPDAAEGITIVSNITDDTLAITDLTSSTLYHCWVRTDCGGEYSAWRQGADFTTQVACAPIENVTITSTTTSGAALSWEFNTSIGKTATEVLVSYRVDGSGSDFTTVSTTNNFYLFSGLEASTIYEYQLRTVCDVDSSSVVSGLFATSPCGLAIDGGTETSSSVPTDVYENYSYAQMLYKAEDIIGLDTIKGVAFNFVNGGISRTVDVYIGMVHRNSITTSNYVELDSLTKVATNANFIFNKGWSSINFDTNIVYDGTSNIAVVVYDHTGTWKPSKSAYVHAGGSAVYKTSYSSMSLSSLYGLSSTSFVPDIIFCSSCPAAVCAAPLVTVGEVTTSEANVVWAAGGLDDTWVVQYKLQSEETWTEFETTQSLSSTITNLQSGSFYDIRVGSICGTDTLFSQVDAFTQCAAIQLPYTETFDAQILNPCITVGHLTSTSVPYLSNDALYFSYTAGGYAVLPEISDDLNTARISFNMKSYNTNARIVVGVGSDKNNWSTFVPMDTLNVSTSSTYEKQMVYFNHYTGAGHYVGFYALGTSIYVDSVVVETAPSCAMPMNISVSDITSDGAVVSWNGDNGSSDGWLVKYTNLATNESFEESTNDNTVTLSGLSADSQYDVMVINLCGEDSIKALRPISFRTECGVMVLPMVESFETRTTGEFPTCWSKLGGSGIVVSSTTYTNDGQKALEMDDGAIVLSPKVPIAGGSIAVDFLLKRAGYNAGKIIVGFTTNCNDISAMEIVDTITPSDNNINLYELEFSDIESTEEGYIVWKQIDRSENYWASSTEYYLDKVYIREISSCVRPEAMTVSNVKHNQALLSWTPVENATEYEVMYGIVNDVNSSSNISQTTAADTLLITGLEGNTTYYAWVRNSCGGSYSDWRTAGEFTTQVNCAKVMNVEVLSTTISGISLSWSLNTIVGAPATSVEVAWKSASDDDYTSITTDNTYYIIQGLELGTNYSIRLRTICDEDTASAYTLTVPTRDCGTIIDGNSNETEYNVPSNISWKYSYAQMLYPATDLTGIDSIKSFAFDWVYDLETTRSWDIYMANVSQSTLNPSNAIPFDSLTLVGSNIQFNTAEGWCLVNLTTPFVYDGTSNLVIAVDDNTGSFPSGSKAFHAHSGNSIYSHSDGQDQNPASPGNFSTVSKVPNIKFIQSCSADMCVAPLLAIDEILSNEATIVWSSNSGNASWIAEYKQAASNDWIIANANVTDTFITIQNLQPGSFYDFRVGTLCNSDTAYSTIEGFTNCAAVNAPLTDNFNNGLNPCWTYGNLDDTGDDPYMLSNALYMTYDANGYAVTPQFVDDLSTLHALFSIKSSSLTAQLVVALGSNPNDFSTFTPIDTFMVTTASTFEPQECSFEPYTGQGHYVAFYCPTGKMYIDDVTIEALPACSFPSNLAISNITDQSATITWTGDNRLSNGWIIDYAVVGDNNITSQQVAASEYSYTMTGLLANTQYEVIVRNACTEDTVAALSSVTFRTECGTLTLPYFENFETVDLESYHPCWFTSGYHTYGDYYFEETAPSVVSTTSNGHVLKFGDNVDMITQRIPAPMNTLMIKFDAKAESSTYTGDIVLGFITNPSNTASITVIDTIEFSNTSWSTYEYSLTNQTTVDTGYFIFKNINNDSYYDYRYDELTYYNGYIDNLLIATDNGCEAVYNVRVSNPTQTTIDIAFSDSNATGSYTVGYATTNNSNAITNTIDITDTTYTLTGLQPGSKYYVWVRNNCTAGGSPWAGGAGFKTLCVAYSDLPYTENFDGYIEDVSANTSAPSTYPNNDMPNCWDFVNLSSNSSTTPSAFLSASASYANRGNCLFMKSSKTTPLYAVLPEFTTHVSAMQISFKYRNEGESGSNGFIGVGVMTDATNPATFTLVKEYPQSTTIVDGYHNFTIDGLDPATNYRIAFRYRGGGSNNYYLSIDEVIVDSASGCAVPENLVCNNLTENSASFAWSGAASSYNVQYRLASASDWTDAPATTTTTTTIAGLTPQTEYYARVQSVCGTEVSAWSDAINFTTMCGAYDIPFSEDFNSYTTDIAPSTSAPSTYPNHTMPSCWNFPTLNGPKIFLSRNSNYAQTGNCLIFASNSSTYSYAALPAMNADIDSLMISFTYCHESTYPNNSPLTVGVMTNPTDTSTFRALETYPIVASITPAEHFFSLDTGFVDGQNYYIAFRYGHVANYYYLGIDNVSVDYAPTCIKPSTPVVSNVTANSADVAWNGLSSSYEVNYKRAADEDWISIINPSTSVSLTNLAPSSSYQVRVRALCTATDTSDWSTVQTFVTECAVMTLPFSENFNAMDGSFSNLHCWERYRGLLSDILAGTDQLESTTSGWSCYNSSTYPINNGGANVYIDIFSTSAKYWLVSPSIAITAGANLTFDMARRDYNGSTEFGSDDKFVVLATSDNGTTWTELRTWQDSTYSNIASYQTSFDSINISLNQYAGQTVKIAFYGESTVSGGDHYIHIDNMEISSSVPTCNVPTNLASADITATSANLSWSGSATTYDVEYRIENATEWTSATMTETSYALTNLQPLTNYQWRVRGNCGEQIGVSEWAEASFTTLELPCPTPTELTATVNQLAVTLDWTADEAQSQWEVIVYTALDTLTEQTATHPITINQLIGATAYKAQVRAICAENVYSDWSEAVEFTTPSCAIVANVAVSEVTENSAIVTWNAGASETSWEVMYGEQDFIESEGISAQVNATTHTITGLTPNTAYDVYVRALCGEDFYSLWSEVVTFTTLESHEGIDGVEGNFQFTIYPNPTSNATTISLNGVEGKVVISVVDMNGRTVANEAIECGVDCEKRIDVSGLSQGTYFVRVLGDNINSVRKLIVR